MTKLVQLKNESEAKPKILTAAAGITSTVPLSTKYKVLQPPGET